MGPLLKETSTFTTEDGVRYADDEDPDHVMSVFLPNGEGPFPALVLIHGGGFRRGSRTDMQWKGEYYARRGIASFSIDYHLSTPETSSWPAAIQDVVCAVRHIKENAESFRIDPDRFGAEGVSAGGFLASMLGTLQGDEPFFQDACGEADVGRRVVLVANYVVGGDLDVLGLLQRGAIGLVAQYLGATYDEDPNLWRLASPHSYISSDDPVFVIGAGTADPTVPIELAISFADQLESAGVENYLVFVEGAGHGGPEIDSAVRAVLEPIIARLLLD